MTSGPRFPERRCATETMIEALMSGLASVREPRLVRERFEETLRALCAFLGEPFEPAMLRFHERTPDQYRTLKHHERLSRPLDTTTLGTFRELSAPEIEIVERQCAAGMRALAYEPVGTGKPAAEAAQPPRRSAFLRVRHRLRYYGWNRQRWRRGLLHWKVVLRARIRYFLRV